MDYDLVIIEGPFLRITIPSVITILKELPFCSSGFYKRTLERV
jgi:hypothetical protein